MELWVFVFQSPFYSHLKSQHVVICCERLHTSANIAQHETTLLAPTMFRVVSSVCMGLNLNLKINVNNTCKAAHYHLTNVRRIRKYLDEKASQTLIHALVIGRIDYCNSILYGLPARELTKLQRLQNSAARIIFNIPKMCHITPVLRELHWLPVKFRIQFKFIMITFKVINGYGLVTRACQIAAEWSI